MTPIIDITIKYDWIKIRYYVNSSVWIFYYLSLTIEVSNTYSLGRFKFNI